MEPFSLGLPRTPNRATSEGPSPPPRNSMEDADSSVTRKRPRLDSGERVYRSMSADGTLSSHSRAEPGRLLSQPNVDDELQGRGHKFSIMSPNSVNGTSTKVTINVRDPALASSPPLPASIGPHAYQHGTSDAPMSSYIQEQPPNHDPFSPQVMTTVSSSPRHSPEIEVAELEDIDGHVGPTVWRAFDHTINFLDIQNSFFDRFPYVDRYTNIIHASATVSHQMVHGGLANGQLLLDLARWIEEFLDQTEPLASQWFNMLTEARDFWEKIPQIVNDLMRRTIKFEDNLVVIEHSDDSHNQDHRKHVREFLAAYAALTARIIRCDCQTLTEYAEDTSVVLDLMSPSYVKTFTFIFWNPRDIPFLKMINHTYGYSVVTMIEAVVFRFTDQSSSGFRCLSQFVDMLLDRSQSQSGVVAEIWQPINTACQLTTFFPKADIRSSSGASSMVMVEQAFQFFQTIEAKLQIFVAKQVSSLSLDLTKSLITDLTATLCNVIIADPSIAEVMTPRDLGGRREVGLDDRVMLVRHAWMFAICKNCITKGRMEIRVLGIDTMQEDLINVYTRYVRPGYEELPVVPQYLADSILKSKLVDYVVGVESHPQLMHRSKNIVGFLVVTGRYTETESDTIWNTVSSTPDSRTIDAVLDMLAGILVLMSYSSLIYLCRKLNDLPMRFFDVPMLAHCKRLLENLIKKWSERGGVYGDRLDMAPYYLCLRLLREATANTSLAPNRRREIRHYALEELRDLMKFGPGDVDRASIIEGCISDIAERSPAASGSMAAINVLLDHRVEDQLEKLVDMSTFASLMVDEFALFTKDEALKSVESLESHDALAIRLLLLQKIIVYAPTAITPDLAPKLWNSLIGEQAIGDYARDHAWAMLAKALSISRNRNSFLEYFITKQIPQVSPRFFTLGVLSFAEKVVRYEMRSQELPNTEAEKGNEHGPPGAELLWHLALVVPNQIIGSKAAGMLVKAYLDVGINRGTRIPQGNASDAWLVERCIRQLIQAASRLKRLSDGTSSGEDDSMFIVASDNDVSVQKICFAQSLSILKEFMQGIRSLFPGSPPSGCVPYSPFVINGDKVSIKYQGFNGSKTTSLRFLEIGDLSTCEDFAKIMTKLTGYSKFSIIAAGQSVKLDDSVDVTIRDLKLLTMGLVLVRKLPDAESFPEQVFNAGLTPLETEVMKHFHELYELLEMEEQQAKDVRLLITILVPRGLTF